jgi:hypothetical protein
MFESPKYYSGGDQSDASVVHKAQGGDVRPVVRDEECIPFPSMQSSSQGRDQVATRPARSPVEPAIHSMPSVENRVVTLCCCPNSASFHDLHL